MTTSSEKNFLGPEYWVMRYETEDGIAKTEKGFRTINSVLRRLKTLQITSYPSTIQAVELSQIFDTCPMDENTVREIEYLDQEFQRAMEDPRK